MRAPSETRKRQRSWTCGSQAALTIVVSPGASAAAMTVFSVAMTDASSRKICVPCSPSVLHLVALADRDLGAEPLERVQVRVEPAPADHVAARAAARSRGRGAPAAGRRAGTTRGCGRRAVVGLVRGDLGRVDAELVRRRATRPRRRRRASSPTIDSTSSMRGTLRERHRLVGEQARGEDRQRAVLVPGGADPAAERMTALDDERLGGHLPTDDGARQRAGW